MDRAAFLQRSKTQKISTVTLGDGTAIKIRKLSQAEVEHSHKNYSTPATAMKGLRYAVTKCALNDDGTPMFEDKDIDELQHADFDDIKKLGEGILSYSGLAVDPKKDAGN